MYLNILNNISFENKRKSKKFTKSDKNDIKEEEKDLNDIAKNLSNPYYSIFHGNLTNNWMKLKP